MTQMNTVAARRAIGLAVLVLAACRSEPAEPVAKTQPAATTAPTAEPVAPTAPPAPAETPPAVPTLGKLAPEIIGEDIDGRPIKLSDYRGKVVMLDFWGNW